MPRTRTLAPGLIVVALVCAFGQVGVAQTTAKSWTHPLTSWGDPDLAGSWPVLHVNGTPVQRPAELGDRRELIYEYACHEGNHAISNALRNSRYLESR